MATTYTVTVQEEDPDLKALYAAGYNLAVAKAVTDSEGGNSVNTIYQGRQLAPSTSVSWTEQYALNWTADQPEPGVKVSFSGTWQPCSLGSGYKLLPSGTWEPKKMGNTKGFLSMQNDWSGSVHVVLGTLQNPGDTEWTPFYFSDKPLLEHGTGSYQPREAVQVWYGTNQKSGTMIAVQQTALEAYEMTMAAAQKNQHWFHYTFATGTWADQDKPYIIPPKHD